MCLKCSSRLILDRSPRTPKAEWVRAKRIEAGYAAQLRKIAKHVADIVNGFDPESWQGAFVIRVTLQKYAQLIEPWAGSVATTMIKEVAARDKDAWNKVAARMGRGLRREIDTAPTGQVMRSLLAEQVTLIKSLPLEAAERVHKLTTAGISQGQRASSIVGKIMETGDVTRSRATLIARTETSRTATSLTMARALHVGSTHFIWHTAGDSDVRASHKKLNGLSFRWDDPPECDPGYHALPGGIWNCRCWPEPLISD